MSGVPPVSLPSIVKTPSFRAPADRVSVTSICHAGVWSPASPDGTDSYQRPELNSLAPTIGTPNVFRIPPSTSLNPLAQQNPSSSTRPGGLSANATFSSNLNQFVSVHPVFTSIPSVPNQPEKDNDTRASRLEVTPTANTPQSISNGLPITAVTRSKSGTPTKGPSLRWTDMPSGGDAGSPRNSEVSSRKKSSRLRCAREHQEEVWRNFFLEAGSSHAVASDFADAMVVPNLQFGDRLLEAFYAQEYYRRGMRRRVICMVIFAFTLIGFQLWFGITKAIKHLNRQNDPPTPVPPSSLFFVLNQSAHERSLASNTPCLRWSNPSEEDVQLPNNIYMAACVDQVVVDIIVILAWLITVHIKRLETRMEAISIFIQLFRTGCFIFFAQGMWSACARSQGPADIMMNNIAIASANLSAFNVIGLGRVRRACFVTLAWFAGLIEVSIVMTQSSNGKSQLTMEDAPQLTLFIVIFLAIPVVTLFARYRAEFGERESLYYAVMLEHTRLLNNGLHNHLAEMEAVKEVDIERSLPEGLVASRIVHVAVMELKGADRLLDAVQSCLNPLLTNLNVAGAPLDNSPNSRMNDLIKYDSSQNFHGVFTKSLKAGYRDHQQQRTSQLATDIHKQTSAFFPRRESGAAQGPWTRLGDLHQRLCTAQTNAQHVNGLQEATNEMRSHIQKALKLLSRSHDLFTAKPQSDYEGAMLFHALGHDGYKAGGRGYQPSASTSRQTSFRLGGGQSQQTVTAGPSAGAMSLPSSMQMPLHPEMGDAARNIGQSWMYDMLKVTRITKDQAIATTAILLAGPIAERFSDVFDWQCWMNFILAIQKEYGPSDKIPYHNRTHAAIHAHATSILLSWFGHAESSGPLESIALLAASLCHDVGHPGRTNAFLVNANKRLALTYNDIAVLENHHASLTFTTLYSRGNNFLARATQEDYRFFRKTVIELILATDMKVHEEIVNAFRLQRNSADFDCWVDSCRMLTLKLIIKGADLSHGAFDWPIHQQLSMAVTEEFWSQGDAEERLGLPKSPLCDRTKPQEVAKSQIGFLEFMVLPLYTELAHADPSGRVKDTCETLIKANMAKWRVMASSHTLTAAHPVATGTRPTVIRRANSDETPYIPPAAEIVALSDSPSFSPIMTLNTPLAPSTRDPPAGANGSEEM